MGSGRGTWGQDGPEQENCDFKTCYTGLTYIKESYCIIQTFVNDYDKSYMTLCKL
jgi:hypothetical protein